MAAPFPDTFGDVGDGALVVAIGRYNDRALAEAYRRHAGAVLSLAGRLLSERADAEEVLQEVFLGLWERPERFDSERGSLRSFLLMQCHGRAVDRLRADAARRQREDRDVRRTAEAGYDLEREVWDMSVAEHLRDALEHLAPTERDAIHLAYFRGHTYREVATILNQPEGTIKTRIRAGLHKLADALDASGMSGTVSA